MKRKCMVVYEEDEKTGETYLTFVSDHRALTLELGDLDAICIEDIQMAFERCGEETE